MAASSSQYCGDGAVFEEAAEPSVYSRDKNHLRAERNECQRSTPHAEIRVQRMRRLRGSSPGEEEGSREVSSEKGVREGKEGRKKVVCLQFGHPGGVEMHGHAGGAGSVAHLPQHAAPLLLVLLVPNESEEKVRRRSEGGVNDRKHANVRGDLLPDVGDLRGCHFFVLRLNHGEAAHRVQGAAAAE